MRRAAARLRRRRAPRPPSRCPGAPTGLTAGTATASTMPLSWTAPVSGGAVSTYSVRWSPHNANTWTTSSNISGTSTTVTGLTANTSYDFEVQAVNAAGSSAWTAPITAATTGNYLLTAGTSPTAGSTWPKSTGGIAVNVNDNSVGGRRQPYHSRLRSRSAGRSATPSLRQAASLAASGTSQSIPGMTGHNLWYQWISSPSFCWRLLLLGHRQGFQRRRGSDLRFAFRFRGNLIRSWAWHSLRPVAPCSSRAVAPHCGARCAARVVARWWRLQRPISERHRWPVGLVGCGHVRWSAGRNARSLPAWNNPAASVADKSGNGNALAAYRVSGSTLPQATPRLNAFLGGVGLNTVVPPSAMPAPGYYLPQMDPDQGFRLATANLGSASGWTWYLVWSRPNWRQGQAGPITLLSVAVPPSCKRTACAAQAIALCCSPAAACAS